MTPPSPTVVRTGRLVPARRKDQLAAAGASRHLQLPFHLALGDTDPNTGPGKTTRDGLNWRGDRQANSALHMIAVVRLRYCARTRANAQRRTAEGRSKREILRCLKRYVAREVFTDYRPILPPTQPLDVYSNVGSSPPSGLAVVADVASAIQDLATRDQ